MVRSSGGSSKRGFPTKQGVLTGSAPTCCRVRGIPAADQGELEREGKSVLGCQPECFNLGTVRKKNIHGLTHPTALGGWGPKQLAGSGSFLVSRRWYPL